MTNNTHVKKTDTQEPQCKHTVLESSIPSAYCQELNQG